MTKSFIMSIMGYTRDEEDSFNGDFEDADFSLDGEVGEQVLGSSWEKLTGQHVVATLDKRTWKPKSGPAREQQDIGTLTPVKT